MKKIKVLRLSKSSEDVTAVVSVKGEEFNLPLTGEEKGLYHAPQEAEKVINEIVDVKTRLMKPFDDTNPEEPMVNQLKRVMEYEMRHTQAVKKDDGIYIHVSEEVFETLKDESLTVISEVDEMEVDQRLLFNSVRFQNGVSIFIYKNSMGRPQWIEERPKKIVVQRPSKYYRVRLVRN